MYSLSRRLVFSVSAPLLLFFIVTSLVLDANFRDLSRRTLEGLLEAQVIALIGAAETLEGGAVAPPALSMDTRFVTPRSGLYAQTRISGAGPAWRSPSAAGTPLDFGPELAPGEHSLDYVKLGNGETVVREARGISFEDDRMRGPNRDITFVVAMSTQSADDEVWRFRRQLLGWFVALTLLLFATLGALLRWVLKPMRRLEREITAVEDGRHEAVSGEYPRELAGVVANLNGLLTAERRRVEHYRETLGNLAHSLKTPLAVMRSAVGSNAAEAAPTVQTQIDRMSGIIEHQLKRAATSSGATLGQTGAKVLPVAAELRAALMRVYGGKDLLIEIDVEESLLFAGDAGDLIELLGNLLDNACKWCRSHVKLTGRSLGTRLEILVEDDGPGISEQDRKRVLGRGVRGDERVPGHGLGLAMAHDTVELYGGSLEIGTSDLGGTRIAIRLPGRAKAEPATP